MSKSNNDYDDYSNTNCDLVLAIIMKIIIIIIIIIIIMIIIIIKKIGKVLLLLLLIIVIIIIIIVISKNENYDCINDIAEPIKSMTALNTKLYNGFHSNGKVYETSFCHYSYCKREEEIIYCIAGDTIRDNKENTRHLSFLYFSLSLSLSFSLSLSLSPSLSFSFSL